MRFIFTIILSFVNQSKCLAARIIIDLATTNNLNSVSNFKILEDSLGKTLHSAHRAICFDINFKSKFEAEVKKMRRVYGLLTKDNFEKFSDCSSAAVISLKDRVDNILVA